jgi:hypothetical protein
VAHRNTATVVLEAKATLDTARIGLEDFLHGQTPGRRLAGLRNVVVFGRAVTNVLQNIRTLDRERFDRWYEPRKRVMTEKPDFKYLYELRTQVLKEGVLGRTTASVEIGEFNSRQIADLPAPANATGFFIGDSLGGSGWTVRLGDGTEERYYAELPTDWRVKAEAHFADVTSALGLTPPNTPIDRLLSQYIDYLANLVAEAEREFT